MTTNINKTGDYVLTNCYLFENAANQEEQVFNAVRAQFNKEFIPAAIETEKMRSGGLILGTREVVISILRQGYPNFYIVTRVVGHYLYVSIVATVEERIFSTYDIFARETLVSYYQACVSCLQNALSLLGLKEYTGHFKGITQDENKPQKQ